MRIRTIQFNRTRGRPHVFLQGVLPIRCDLKVQSGRMSKRKRMQRAHAVRVNRECFFGLANRLAKKCSIRLVLSLSRMSPRPKGDFVSTEVLGVTSISLEL